MINSIGLLILTLTTSIVLIRNEWCDCTSHGIIDHWIHRIAFVVAVCRYVDLLGKCVLRRHLVAFARVNRSSTAAGGCPATDKTCVGRHSCTSIDVFYRRPAGAQSATPVHRNSSKPLFEKTCATVQKTLKKVMFFL